MRTFTKQGGFRIPAEWACAAGMVLSALLAGCAPSPVEISIRPAETGPPRQSFTVVSYNIQARPLLDDCSWKSPLIGERLRSCDLAGLQESFHGYRQLFEQNALHSGVRFSRRRHLLKPVNSGLAILSRFPVTGAEAEYFEDEGSLENRAASKGVLLARIELNCRKLDFYTTHLAAGTPADSGEARRNQLKQFAAFIRRHSPPDHAVIACGDFNLQPASPELAEFLEEAGLQSSTLELGFSGCPPIDHILYRPSAELPLRPVCRKLLKKEFTVEGRGPLSDHAPLLVEFRIDSAAEVPVTATPAKGYAAPERE